MKVVKYSNTTRAQKRNRYYKTRKERAVLDLVERALACTNGLQVDASIAIAYLLSATGLTRENYQLHLSLIETNNPFVVDALVGRKDPVLYFSSLKPHWNLLKLTFLTLSRYKRDEIYEKTLLAFLGIVQNAYKISTYGYSIYPPNISDIYNIGKFLDKTRDQNDGTNRLILDILLDIYQVGRESNDRKQREISISANRIRMSYFDDTKEMMDSIPAVLLVTDPQSPEAVNPSHYDQ